MNREPVTQVADGLYKVGLAFALLMPLVGTAFLVTLYLTPLNHFR